MSIENFRFGVPERVDSHNIVKKDETCIISVRDIDDVENNDDIGKVDKFSNKYPGDYIYLYKMDLEETENEDVKNEISTAYDKVGATANISGYLNNE